MKKNVKVFSCLAALLVAAASLAACSQKNAGGQDRSGNRFGGWTESGSGGGDRQGMAGGEVGGQGSSTRTHVYGRVKSVVGNQVELEVGTMGSGSSGGDAQQSASSAQSSGTSSGSAEGSSASFSPTGETKTVLIPVGLTLSASGAGGFGANRASEGTASAGTASRASGGFSAGGSRQRSGSAGGFTAGAGGFSAGGTQTRTGDFPAGAAGSTSSSARTGTGTGTLTTGTVQRSRDFSSIKAGMVLLIVENKADDGTDQILLVRVVSE